MRSSKNGLIEMKIGIIIHQDDCAGGGFQQAINAIIQLSSLEHSPFEVCVYTTSKRNISELNKFEIESKLTKWTFLDSFFFLLCRFDIFLFLQHKLRLKSIFEKKIINDGVDLIYFISPSIRSITFQELPYIFTVWDLCHLDHPEFPEVRNYGEFERREFLYSRSIRKSFLTIVDSEKLSSLVQSRYGMDADRIIVMPFSPSPYISNSSHTCDSIISKYNIPPEYIFYPAQFWPHKNHTRILLSIKELEKHGHKSSIVFSGGDMGAKNELIALSKKLGINDRTHFIGFVDSEDLAALYSNAQCLLMPTYFGPTNLPPLEAWKCGTPVLYSNELKSQVGDAAICFDPDSAKSIAESIITIQDIDTKEKVVNAGFIALERYDAARKSAEEKLLDKLLRFKSRLLCWKPQFEYHR